MSRDLIEVELSTKASQRQYYWWLGGLFGAVAIACYFFTGWRANQLVRQGADALNRGEIAAATERAERAVQISPNFAPGWKLLVESASRSSRLDRACDALERFAELQPAEGGGLALHMGRKWMHENRIRNAARALKISEKLNYEARLSLQLQERIAAVTGHPRETVRCILEMVKRELLPPVQRRSQAAVSQFADMRQPLPFTKDDLLLVSSLFPFTVEPIRLEAILRADPSYKSPLLAKAIVPAHTERIDFAEQILLEITQAHPDDLEAQGTLAELYAVYFPQKFLAWHSKLPAAANDDAVIWSARGKWLSEVGKTELAVRCLHESLLREPELITTTALLGQLLKSINELELGTAFAERSQHLQRVLDLNGRMKESRGEEFVLPMIEELEKTGRLWEAWGWSALYKQDVNPTDSWNNAQLARLKSRLSPEIPRTIAGSLPGGNFPWNRYPLPDWSSMESLGRKTSPPERIDRGAIRFEDQAEPSGLSFRFISTYDPAQGRRIYESMGAGVAVLDYDLDGWPDLYFPQGRGLPLEGADGPSDQLFRNIQGNAFANVTDVSGVHEPTYSQGVAAGDFDNDGFPDVYVANLGRNRLYRNHGDGTFSDVTNAAGLKQTAWTVSCAIADLNGDGSPELFDVNYLQGKELLSKVCRDANNHPVVCRPTAFEPALDTVSISMGDGRFQEKQAECGLDLPRGMGLGLVVADFNGDRRPDIFVANDMTPNYLLINQQTRPDQPLSFIDEALLRGVAFDFDGLAQACMGVALADINRDGQPDLLVTNFFDESNTLYLSQPGGFYTDSTLRSGLREPSIEMLGFGTQFFDADQDGYPDLVVMNGHVDRHMKDPYEMKPQLFRGLPDSRFVELFGRDAGKLFDQPRLGRGLATFDWNRDGRMDFVATDLEGPVLLGVNQTEPTGKSIRLRFVGTQSSRDAIGTRVIVTVSDGDQRVAQLSAGDGYEASNERVIEIGVGDVNVIQRIEVQWPSGINSTGTNIATATDWVIIEGRDDWVPRQVYRGTADQPAERPLIKD